MRKWLIRGGVFLVVANEVRGAIMVAMIGPGLVKAVWGIFS